MVVDNIGNVINTQESDLNKEEEVSMGEELNNILKHIIEVSKTMNVKAKPLWLPKMSDVMYVDNLEQMFSYQEESFILNPLIGMYDDPNNQHQDMVTMPLTANGNSLIYGSSGSGKELLLTTLVYSLIKWHTPDEVNLYIIDFGGGTLKMFSKAPHVGDVILSSQEEKIKNLFKAINGEIAKRKKLFANFNGDYQSYIKNSGKTIPYTIVIINNYDSFIDAYDYSEEINQISRECDKYGIILIFTVNNTSSVRYKTKQNFKEDIALQFNDVDDYSVVLGNVRKMYPANIYGRGLVKLDTIYEFQTAYVSEKDNMLKFITEKCQELSDKYQNRAQSIPVVPEVVDVYNYVEKASSLKKVPLGISHEYVDIEYFDFIGNYGNLISANEMEIMANFTEALTIMLSSIKNCNLCVLDGTESLEISSSDNVSYNTTNFEEVIQNLLDDVNRQHELYTSNGHNNKVLINEPRRMVMIYGLDKLIVKIGLDNKKKLEEIINKGKELGTLAFIYIDTPNNIKKYEFDSWYKPNVANSFGIWIGSGVDS
ncbi:MAG: hypothetical protein IJO27_04205, partial [Bacilli bacterium]|nr:hypothetical protein [Bacilli bacterium]